MLIVSLTSGKELDAQEIEVEQDVVKLLDRNGDVMHRVGHPLVNSISQAAI